MRRSRSFVRSLLVILVVAGCVAAAIAPVLMPARAAPKAASVNHIVISEFRSRGPSGATDEFVELFNPTTSPQFDITGWTIKSSAMCDPSATNVVTAATIKPVPPATRVLLDPGHHFLIVGASYSGSVAPDYVEGTPLGIDEQGGIGLFDTTNASPVDAVGMCFDTFLVEGTALDPFPSADVDKSYDRNADGSSCADTDNNATDFFLRSPSDPQDMTSPITTCGNPTPVPSPTNTLVPSTPTNTALPGTATNTPLPGSLSVVINEVGWMGTQESGTDQWIELYNPNAWNILVKDWTLRGAGGTMTLTGTINAHCYLVIEKNSNIFESLPTDQCQVKTLVASNLSLSTYGAALFLNSNTGALIDTANNNGGPWPAGLNTASNDRRSMERHAVIADTDTAWYTFEGAPRVIVYDKGGHAVKGTPGQRNWAYGVNATPSPMPTRYKTPTSPPPTPFAHMVINEFLPRAGHDWNQDGTIDVFDEFIEVKNLGPIDVDVRGWKLSVISSAGSNSFVLPSQRLKTNERAVFYRSTTQLSLPDSGGTVRLINTRGIVIDARSYGPVDNPDQATCRLPDGAYWSFPCFPTPGLLNTKTGFAPAPPPSTAGHPPACLLADTVPLVFRDAECNGFGSDIFNAKYWDDQSGFKDFPVLDVLSKWLAVVR